MPLIMRIDQQAMRVTPGITSIPNANCFPVNPSMEISAPVRRAPGRASLAARPEPTGSTKPMPTTAIVSDARRAANAAGKRRQPLVVSVRVSLRNIEVQPFDITSVSHRLQKAAQPRRHRRCIKIQNGDKQPAAWSLRTRCDRTKRTHAPPTIVMNARRFTGNSPRGRKS